MKFKTLFAAALGLVAFGANAINAGDTVTVGDKQYAVGENIIVNGDFSNGLTGWISGEGQITDANWKVEATGPEGKNALVALDGGGSGSGKSIRTPYDIVPGKTYLMSFYYKNCGDWSRIGVSNDPTSADDKAGVSQRVYTCDKTATDWTNALFTFCSPEGYNKCVINFAWLLANSSSYADFFLAEATEVTAGETPVDPVEPPVSDDPYAGKSYKFFNAGTGLYWSTGFADGHNRMILDVADNARVFKMIKGEGAAYNVMINDGRYICSDNWDAFYRDLGENINYNFTILTKGGNNYFMNMEERQMGKVFACNQTTAGNPLWADKDVDYNAWESTVNTSTIELQEVEFVFTNAWILENAAVAEDFFNTTEEGEENGQYPAAARTALSEAIAAAKAAPFSTRDEIVAAIAAVNSALDTYKAARVSKYVSPYDGKSYKIKQAGTGLYWGTKKVGNDLQLLVAAEGNAEVNYYFQFETTTKESAADGFTMVLPEGRHVYRTSWNMFYGNPVLTEASSIFNVVEQNGKFYIKNEGSKKILASDSDADLSPLYSDKAADKTANGKNTAEVVLEEVTDFAFNNAWVLEEVAAAEELYNSTEEGDLEGQFSAAARTEFANAIATAKAQVIESYEDIVVTIEGIKAAIADYKAAKNEAPLQQVAEGKYTFASVACKNAFISAGWHANSWEATNYVNGGILLSAENGDSYNQIFDVVAVEGAKPGIYNLVSTKTGEFFINKNGALLLAAADADKTVLDAQFAFEFVAGDTVAIRNRATEKFVGPDDNKAGWTWQHMGTKHEGGENGHLFVMAAYQESGVGSIANGNATISALRGAVRVAGANNVAVYTVAGVAVATANGDAEIALPAGAYIVRADNAARLVIIR